MIQRMEKLMIISEQNHACIGRLLQTVMTFVNPTLKPDGLPELPLKSYEDFKKLEELLSEKTIDTGGREIPGPAYTYLVQLKIIVYSFIIYI